MTSTALTVLIARAAAIESDIMALKADCSDAMMEALDTADEAAAHLATTLRAAVTVAREEEEAA